MVRGGAGPRTWGRPPRCASRRRSRALANFATWQRGQDAICRSSSTARAKVTGSLPTNPMELSRSGPVPRVDECATLDACGYFCALLAQYIISVLLHHGGWSSVWAFMTFVDLLALHCLRGFTIAVQAEEDDLALRVLVSLFSEAAELHDEGVRVGVAE